MSLFNKENYHISKKIVVLIISAVMLVFTLIGGTIAYLTSYTSPVENEFTPAEVSCEVIETFENNVKSDVMVKNTGNVDSFIRVAIVANFVAEDGTVSTQSPVADVDYIMEFGDSNWKKGSDGFWYYGEKVAPNNTTEKLINSVVELDTAPEGYNLSIQIVASAIQANPEDVVKEYWGADVRDGYLYVE